MTRSIFHSVKLEGTQNSSGNKITNYVLMAFHLLKDQESTKMNKLYLTKQAVPNLLIPKFLFF